MRTLTALWAVISLAWMGAVGYACVNAWPHMSLDLSTIDPQTQAAFDQAQMMHVLYYAAIAIVPPLVVFLLGWLLRPRT